MTSVMVLVRSDNRVGKDGRPFLPRGANYSLLFNVVFSTGMYVSFVFALGHFKKTRVLMLWIIFQHICHADHGAEGRV